ncbi:MULTISPECIES: hypothetical protein [Mycolicibacterium]|uniref:hypothetical protein n=1 Tax=Mycolicibacterium TaxID=1866885 RepID=UPI00055E47E7|nr:MULTISPECIES: hypothetical protein [Mycolicibacterium]QZY48320.1 hypothetical protein K5L12_11875 [Mycolicibacterium austroafricanum]WND58950.1 hypothetical protein QQA43_11495 [Mycolicibacterium vanbaalenii]
MPDELRSFDGYGTPADFHRTAARIAAWLDTQAPGHAAELVYGVMQAAGLSATNWYRAVFDQQATENRKALTRPDATA